jgi:hypothetical protein
MLIKVNIEEAKNGDSVTVMSDESKVLVAGEIIYVDKSSQCLWIKITGLITKIEPHPHILKGKPTGNRYLKIGDKVWFTKAEVFQKSEGA